MIWIKIIKNIALEEEQSTCTIALTHSSNGISLHRKEPLMHQHNEFLCCNYIYKYQTTFCGHAANSVYDIFQYVILPCIFLPMDVLHDKKQFIYIYIYIVRNR